MKMQLREKQETIYVSRTELKESESNNLQSIKKRTLKLKFTFA